MVKSPLQNHLNHNETINYGSYYTPEKLVNLVYKVLSQNILDLKKYKILDTSCGYGNFLQDGGVGADIDFKAFEVAKKNKSNCIFFNHNSLKNIGRKQYDLKDEDKIIIVGNPPYNDTTSIIRSDIKKEFFDMDFDVKSRDFGISFLLSYNKLKADYVCVLHPLSYLIKKSNFELLGDFKQNYKLEKSIIISSHEFSLTSKITPFPIVIAFYKKSSAPMTYLDICNYKFQTIDNKNFSISEFESIAKYTTKYPNQKTVKQEDAIAYFWTMRDINALKRSKTFTNQEFYNSIRVTKNNFSYYCYADVFKDYIKHIPYYFGNSEIMINHSEFKKIEQVFVAKSISKHDFLKKYEVKSEMINCDLLINNYFKNLLKEHYVDK